MNKPLVIVAIFVIVLAVAGAFFYAKSEAPTLDNEPVPNGNVGRGMSIEEYVRANISDLSPEPAVLGGTFYVTAIETNAGVGVVEYEDGHIALTADFTYTIEPEHGAITITSFVVRPQ